MRAALALLLFPLAACRCDEPPVRTLHPFPERYAGVGLELEIRRGWPVVVRVLPGGSAAAANLRPGDAIVEIDGAATGGWDLADVVAALRGEAGTQVVLGVRRGSATERHVLARTTLARPGDGGLDARLYRGVR